MPCNISSQTARQTELKTDRIEENRPMWEEKLGSYQEHTFRQTETGKWRQTDRDRDRSPETYRQACRRIDRQTDTQIHTSTFELHRTACVCTEPIVCSSFTGRNWRLKINYGYLIVSKGCLAL